jgi:predicted PolB exonuclease-like 3'-5' exonuclease
MYTVTINKIAADAYKVTVYGKTITEHRVTMHPDYMQQLTHGKMNDEALIKNSFEFLLEHEDNTSILSNFDLSVIARYFPDYERVIKRML